MNQTTIKIPGIPLPLISKPWKHNMESECVKIHSDLTYASIKLIDDEVAVVPVDVLKKSIMIVRKV